MPASEVLIYQWVVTVRLLIFNQMHTVFVAKCAEMSPDGISLGLDTQAVLYRVQLPSP
jgi:hypothetical protein